MFFTGAASGLGGFQFFKTPSGKIVCEWATARPVVGMPRTSVECGVATGLKPPIPKAGPDCQQLDCVGSRVGLAATGRVRLIACACDAGPFGEPGRTVYLHYGQIRSGGGIVCRASVRGLICRNRDGHGFFLSLRSWHVF